MKTSIFIILLLMALGLFAQPISIDARIDSIIVLDGHLKMGNAGPKGKEIKVNSKFLTLGGEPILPIMGEVHFSRIARENWEDILLKMKANGINIIAFYAFWIHHEEEKGIFRWDDRYDMRAFVELCKKHGLWAYPRIGPWCHGEVRNGGLPDWIVDQNEFRYRTNDSIYMSYVDRWYSEIGRQLSGLYYNNNGPVIGIQFENEYWRGKGGEAHIMALKELAQHYGMDVPLYTVTGWRNASVPPDEVIPLWGGYPAAPWNTDLNKITNNPSYVFSKPINDQSIGHKEQNDRYSPDYSRYPYLTCELGVGNQISEHRRPIIDPIDGMAIATASLASGSNLPGYYVFAGGLNPVGKFTTLEEDRWESGYWNEYPDISYDFQAAISETGEIAPAYQWLKPLHYFLNDFGGRLATMHPVIHNENANADCLQYSFRVKDNSGFLFFSNYSRGVQKSVKEGVQFSIQLPDEKIVLPSKPVVIADSVVAIWPVNFEIKDVLLKYATIQPICAIPNRNSTDWYFQKFEGIEAELVFSANGIKKCMVDGKMLGPTNGTFHIRNVATGLEHSIVIQSEAGSVIRIFLLSEAEARMFWHFNDEKKELAFISNANLLLDEQSHLRVSSRNEDVNIVALNSLLKGTGQSKTIDGFQSFDLKHSVLAPEVSVVEKYLFDNAGFLSLHNESYRESKELYQKQFFKSFLLENSAEIRTATAWVVAGREGKMRINRKWVNQSIDAGVLTRLDLTGYLKKGENNLMVNFLNKNDEAIWAMVLEVEYYNAQRAVIASDSSWQTILQYKIPAPWEEVKGLTFATVQVASDEYLKLKKNHSVYELKWNAVPDTLSKAYLRINYTGDKSRIFVNGELKADNFNNGTTWSVDISGISGEDGLLLEVESMEKEYKIYFDRLPDESSLGKARIDSVWIDREWSETLEVE